jgi:hypothetical protein
MRVRQWIFILFALVLTGMTLDLTPQSAAAQQCNYYASPDGRGDGLSESSPFQISDFLSMPESEIRGKTLCLLDGTYYESLNISKSGTASQPITVTALHDGQVTIDGENSRAPILITGNYIVVEGLVCRNGAGDGMVKISGGDYNILRRISAYDNSTPRSHIFLLSYGADNNLVEDCAGGGHGRYRFDVFQSENNIFRRCYALYQSSSGGSPRAGFCPYGADNNIFENCISRDVYPADNEIDTGMEYYGIYQEHNQNPDSSNNNKYLGCISFNNLHGGIRLNPSTGPNTWIVNSVFFDHDRAHPAGIQDGWTGWGVYGDGYSQGFQNLTMRNNTFINNRRGGAVIGPNPIINSLFVGNNPALGGTGNHEYCNFYDNSSIGTSVNSTDLQLNPNFDLNKYGKGAYLFSPPALRGKGQNNQDIGANVLFRYRNQELTTEPLWPWPMEERICDELGISVTWENSDQISKTTGQRCTGGLWKTLDGVYDVAPFLQTHISASSLSGVRPLSVDFTASAAGGTPPYNYSWDFGDGYTSNEQNPTHIFHGSGTYTVLLSVSDNDGNQATDSESISVTPASSSEDINLDGKVDILDVQLCVNVLTGWETDAELVKRADVNNDGTVNTSDIQQIVSKIWGS